AQACGAGGGRGERRHVGGAACGRRAEGRGGGVGAGRRGGGRGRFDRRAAQARRADPGRADSSLDRGAGRLDGCGAGGGGEGAGGGGGRGAAVAAGRSAEARQRIEKLLAAPLDAPPPETVRFLRAVQALEGIGSPAAREVLQRLAKGDPAAAETKAAAAALRR